jgi:hypothetical protein
MDELELLCRTLGEWRGGNGWLGEGEVDFI